MICNYHLDSMDWNECSPDALGNCDIALAKEQARNEHKEPLNYQVEILDPLPDNRDWQHWCFHAESLALARDHVEHVMDIKGLPKHSSANSAQPIGESLNYESAIQQNRWHRNVRGRCTD